MLVSMTVCAGDMMGEILWCARWWSLYDRV